MGFSRQEYWSWLSFPSPKDQTWVSCVTGRFLYRLSYREAHACMRVCVFGGVCVLGGVCVSLVSWASLPPLSVVFTDVKGSCHQTFEDCLLWPRSGGRVWALQSSRMPRTAGGGGQEGGGPFVPLPGASSLGEAWWAASGLLPLPSPISAPAHTSGMIGLSCIK